MARITQKDIAKKLGVSPSLVSRALAGTAEGIGADPDTIQRIQQQATALGYVPNAAARQLRGTGQPALGLIAADLEDPFFGPAVAEVIRQSHRTGYALTLAGFERREPGLSDVNLLLQHDLKGLLILGGGALNWAKPFVDRHIPVVRIGRGTASPGVWEVKLDEAKAAELIVHHLLQLGHREFAFVGALVETHEQRLRLVRDVLRQHHFSIRSTWAQLASTDVLEAGMAGVEQMARAHRDEWPTAIICSSDTVALGVLRALTIRGLRVPEQVSVTGYDDLALTRLTSPQLTSIRQPLPDMVQEALQLVRGEKSLRSLVPHPPQLITRASTTNREMPL